jgi:hypothetical protein
MRAAQKPKLGTRNRKETQTKSIRKKKRLEKNKKK